jgi:hypothetical protein
VAKGAGHGATLLPWSRPAVPTPLAIAFTPASHARAVHHFGYRLAGYHQLTRRSRVGGILYRLGVQLRPLAWFLPRRADEPWDDAWLARADEARLEALGRWLPRRPTLIVLEGEAADSAGRVAQALAHAAQHGDQPVRLLVLGKRPADTPPASRSRRSKLALRWPCAPLSGWADSRASAPSGFRRPAWRPRRRSGMRMMRHQRAWADHQQALGLLLGRLPLGFPLGPALLLGLGGLLHLDPPTPLGRLAGLTRFDAVHVLHHLLGPSARLGLIPHTRRRQRIHPRSLTASPAGPSVYVTRPSAPTHLLTAQACPPDAMRHQTANTKPTHDSRASKLSHPATRKPHSTLGRRRTKCETPLETRRRGS